MGNDNNLIELRESIKKCLAFFGEKLSGIRSGKVNAGLVENIQIECYGSNSPLKNLANLVVQPPNVILVEPWDPTVLNSISKAIESSNLGVNPQKDVNFLRLIFPSLTQERRDQLIKFANSEKEECRIEVKKLREGTLKKVNSDLNNKLISEDEQKFLEKEVQKEIDKANENIETMTDKKIAELKEF